jgi:ribosome maturation factor RimP
VYSDNLSREVHDAVEPVLSGMGYALVELAVGRRKGITVVSVVIYRREGVGVDDCAAVSELLLPRLETMESLPDVSLEVSSPGIERAIHGPEEYGIFQGRGVRILAADQTEWQSGIIDRCEGGTLWVRKGKEHIGFALGDIRRARLDYSVEVEEDKNAV